MSIDWNKERFSSVKRHGIHHIVWMRGPTMSCWVSLCGLIAVHSYDNIKSSKMPRTCIMCLGWRPHAD